MINLRFHHEPYDTDKIISIELIENYTIKISMLNERRHYFNYTKETQEEAIRDYNELMNSYNEAVTKRKNGEEVDTISEMLRQNNEVVERIRRNEIEKPTKNINENNKSGKKHQFEQDVLFQI